MASNLGRPTAALALVAPDGLSGALATLPDPGCIELRTQLGLRAASYVFLDIIFPFSPFLQIL